MLYFNNLHDWPTSFYCYFFPGQRILQYKSDVLETVVLVNPTEDTTSTEVREKDAVPLSMFAFVFLGICVWAEVKNTLTAVSSETKGLLLQSSSSKNTNEYSANQCLLTGRLQGHWNSMCSQIKLGQPV